MNCLFIILDINEANPHDFQRVARSANMPSHLLAFLRYPFLYCGEAIRRLKFHFKHEGRDLFVVQIRLGRHWRASLIGVDLQIRE